jgi:Helix-turn-helix domain
VRKIGWIFTALAHSTRRAILRRLAKGEATVGEVRDLFQISHAATHNQPVIRKTWHPSWIHELRF